MGKAALVLVYVVGTVVAGAVVAAAGCCCWRRLRYPRRGCFDVVATTLADEPSAYPSIQRLMSLLLTLRGYCTPREAKERPPSRRASLSAEIIATVPGVSVGMYSGPVLGSRLSTTAAACAP